MFAYPISMVGLFVDRQQLMRDKSGSDFMIHPFSLFGFRWGDNKSRTQFNGRHEYSLVLESMSYPTTPSEYAPVIGHGLRLLFGRYQ